MDFIRVPKKRPFKERLEMVARILNDKGAVSVKDLVFNWGVTPQYAVTILKWAREKYPYADWDGGDRILFIPERKERWEKEKKKGAKKMYACSKVARR